MPGYIPDLLKAVKHTPSKKFQCSPHPVLEIICGAKTQLVLENDHSPILDNKNNTPVRSIIGSVLFLSRMLDSSLLISCNETDL